jgi:lysophospholipase L1-like esterase
MRSGRVTSSPRSPLVLAAVTVVISLALGGLVLFGIAEAFLRLTRSPVGTEIQRGRSLEFEATVYARSAFPQVRQRKQATMSGAVEISERGYRGPAFAVPKPPGVIRVVMLGGSSLFDMYAKEGSDWPRLTERYLRTAGLGAVEVINAGTPGHDSADSLGRFYAEMWMFEPDYVLVYHAWNDIKYFPGLTPERSLLRRRRPQTSQGGHYGYLVANPFIYDLGAVDRWLGHSQLYARLRDRYLQRRLGTVGTEGIATDARPRADDFSSFGPRQFEVNLRLIVAAARSAGAEPVLATEARLITPSNSDPERQRIAYELAGLSHDALVRAFEACDRTVFTVAGDEKVSVLDLSARYSGRPDLFEDHVHTTAAGSEALARATSEFLQGAIARASGRPGSPSPRAGR